MIRKDFYKKNITTKICEEKIRRQETKCDSDDDVTQVSVTHLSDIMFVPEKKTEISFYRNQTDRQDVQLHACTAGGGMHLKDVCDPPLN